MSSPLVRFLRQAVAVVTSMVTLSSCGVRDTHSSRPLLASERWAILPFLNYAESPQAGEKTEAILSTLLRKRGVAGVSRYPAVADTTSLPNLDDRLRHERALAWARKEKFKYGVSGAVTEWRYKTTGSGEPAAGVSVDIVDLEQDAVVWSGTGARVGWNSQSVSGTCQQLLNHLLEELRLE